MNDNKAINEGLLKAIAEVLNSKNEVLSFKQEFDFETDITKFEIKIQIKNSNDEKLKN